MKRIIYIYEGGISKTCICWGLFYIFLYIRHQATSGPCGPLCWYFMIVTLFGTLYAAQALRERLPRLEQLTGSLERSCNSGQQLCMMLSKSPIPSDQLKLIHRSAFELLLVGSVRASPGLLDVGEVHNGCRPGTRGSRIVFPSSVTIIKYH